MSSSKNHYELLGVGIDAEESEIRKAYRQLSLKYHPDRNDSADAVERFKEINEANEVLSDTAKREQYDFDLKHGKGAFEQQESMNDMNNIINQMFGQGMGFPFPGMAFNMRGGGGAPNVQIFHNGHPVHMGGGGGGGDPFAHFFQQIHKPSPIQTTVSITLEQCYKGGNCKVSFERNTIFNGIRSIESLEIEIPIPQGIHPNETIVLENQGHSMTESQRGDLHIRFDIQKHELFRREGNDLFYQVTIPLREAICGFNMSIQHLNGKTISMNNQSNPTIVKPNYKKTVPGLGMVKNGATGNLFIEFTVEFPDQYSADIIEQLKTLL